MSRILKIVTGLLLLIATPREGRSFSLLGPFETWQDDVLQYVQGNIGGPRALGFEFRWNFPTITYGFDDSFLNFFGSNGVHAIEQAAQIINDLPPFSEMSKSLREFPLDTRRENFRASAVGLLDLKSYALHFLIEEMGLASAETYVWTLRGEEHLTGTPPPLDFLVIRLNYDPETLEPSSYVNDVLYTYDIFHSNNPHAADALESVVDPFSFSFSSVSFGIPSTGIFFTGLTRDDIGGLRYIYNSQNVNVETLPPNSTIQPVPVTNTTQLVTVQSFDLASFSDQAMTNSTATLLGLFPNLVFTNTNSFFTNIVVSNQLFFFTNAPWAPAGSFPVLATNTTFFTNVFPRFTYVFDNVLTNHFSPNCLVRIEEMNVNPAPYDPRFNPFLTNVTQTVIISNNCPSGDIIIVPPNLFGYDIVGTQLVTVTERTNTIFDVIDPFSGLERRLDVVTFETNYTYLAFPIERFVPTNSTTVARPGVGRINLQRVDFDSLLGSFVVFTNIFVDQYITNGTLASQTIERIVPNPDIVFAAGDLGVTMMRLLPVGTLRNSGWQDNSAINGFLPVSDANGPGQIVPTIQISFSTVLNGATSQGTYPDPDPAALFVPNAEISPTQILIPTWGSFDGTTNAPIVYPVGNSIEALERAILRP